LSAMREAAITVRLECLISAGQIDTTAAELESLVIAEPLGERWWGLLMIVRYRQDRQADALQAFQQVRTVLAEELGLEPGPELRDLEAKILRHDPSLGPSSTAMFSKPRRDQQQARSELPRRLDSFIGRAGHIEAL